MSLEDASSLFTTFYLLLYFPTIKNISFLLVGLDISVSLLWTGALIHGFSFILFASFNNDEIYVINSSTTLLKIPPLKNSITN
jgi:hypothetical protein